MGILMNKQRLCIAQFSQFPNQSMSKAIIMWHCLLAHFNGYPEAIYLLHRCLVLKMLSHLFTLVY